MEPYRFQTTPRDRLLMDLRSRLVLQANESSGASTSSISNTPERVSGTASTRSSLGSTTRVAPPMPQPHSVQTLLSQIQHGTILQRSNNTLAPQRRGPPLLTRRRQATATTTSTTSPRLLNGRPAPQPRGPRLTRPIPTSSIRSQRQSPPPRAFSSRNNLLASIRGERAFSSHNNLLASIRGGSRLSRASTPRPPFPRSPPRPFRNGPPPPPRSFRNGPPPPPPSPYPTTPPITSTPPPTAPPTIKPPLLSPLFLKNEKIKLKLLKCSCQGFSVARRLLCATTEPDIVNALNDLENIFVETIQYLKEMPSSLNPYLDLNEISEHFRSHWMHEIILCAKETKKKNTHLWSPVAALAFGRCLKLMREDDEGTMKTEETKCETESEMKENDQHHDPSHILYMSR